MCVYLHTVKHVLLSLPFVFFVCVSASLCCFCQTKRSQTACDPSSRVQGPAISSRRNVATVSAHEEKVRRRSCEDVSEHIALLWKDMWLSRNLWQKYAFVQKRSLYCVDFTVCVCPHVCVHAFPVSFTLHMLLECTCTCHRSCVKLYDFQWLSVVYSHSSSWVFMTELLPTRNTFYFRRACVFLPICVHVPKLRGLTWWAKDVVFAQCT